MGARFQAVDLRWGISQEAGRDQQTMRMCLLEIDRCRRTTPRPNFIALIGERYGWRPLPDAMPAGHFRSIIRHAGAASGRARDAALLRRWYRRDDNAASVVYTLQPRTGPYADDAVWQRTEHRLHLVLATASRRMRLREEDRLRYGASATEQEIFRGAMSVPDAPQHVHCFVRRLAEMPARSVAEFVDLDASGRVDGEAKQRLDRLKRRLRELLGGNVHEYALQLGDGVSRDYLTRFCNDVHDALAGIIRAEVASWADIDEVRREADAHRRFGRERAQFFVGREDVRAAIRRYLAGRHASPLIVHGPSGSGKSAVMAASIERVLEEAGPATLVFRFLGVTPESSNVRTLLASLCREISQAYGQDPSNIPAQYRELVEDFHRRLGGATADRPLVVFLDALDQLSSDSNWIPSRLPPHVRLIVSTLEDSGFEELRRRIPAAAIQRVEPMPVAEGGALVDRWLEHAGRRLQRRQRRDVLVRFAASGLPLYLRLVFEQARHWKSFEAPVELAPDVPGVIRDLFRELGEEANHGSLLVGRSLAYLAAAKNGLSEGELLDVLSTANDGEVLRDWRRRSPHSPLVDRLPMILWSRLYFDLEAYLGTSNADGAELLGFYHRQLRDVVLEDYLSDGDAAARHSTLADYFGAQPLEFETGPVRTPNLRRLSELPHQLAHAGRWSELADTLTTFEFMEVKVRAAGVQALIDDYDLALDPRAGPPRAASRAELVMIAEALRLSAHAVTGDPAQLPAQLLGRLQSMRGRRVRSALAAARKWARRPWLRPLRPSLRAPGGPLLRTIAGAGPMRALAVTPDGKQVVCSVGDDSIRVWDATTGVETRAFPHMASDVTSIAVTPDGRRVLATGTTNKLWAWDFDTGETLAAIKGAGPALALTHDGLYTLTQGCDPQEGIAVQVRRAEDGAVVKALIAETGFHWTSPVWDLAVTADNRYAVAAVDDHTVRVWDLESGGEVRKLTGHRNQVHAVAVSPDARRIVSGERLAHGARLEASIRVWDFESGAMLREFVAHSSDISALAVTRDNRRIVSASLDKTIRIWDIDSGKQLRELGGHADEVSGLALLPNGRHLASASRDGTVRIWDPERNEAPAAERHAGAVEALAVSADNRIAITGSVDETLKVWNLETGALLRTLEAPGRSQDYTPTGQRVRQVTSVAVLPGGRYGLAGSYDGTVQLWDFETGANLGQLHGYGTALATTPDGRTAVTAVGEHTKTVAIWDLTGTNAPALLEGHGNYVGRILTTSDGGRIISIEHFQAIVWDLQARTRLHSFRGHGAGNQIPAVALLPGDGRLLIGELFGLKLRDLSTGAELRNMPWPGANRTAHTVAVTPDGRRAVVVYFEPPLEVWDLEDWKRVAVLQGHTHHVYGCVAIADSRHALSISRDRTARLWHLDTGACVATYSADEELAHCVASADGKTVVIGGKDGGVHIVRIQGLG